MCVGTAQIPGDAVLGPTTLVIRIEDDLGNLGEDTVGVNVLNPPAGGGGGTPANAKVNLTIDEESVEVSYGEIVTVPILIENTGRQYLGELKLSLSGIPSGNYEFTEQNFALDIGESKYVGLKISPVNLPSGTYTIKVEVENNIVKDSDLFVLIYNNTMEANATAVCDQAENYINELEANGTDVTNLTSQDVPSEIPIPKSLIFTSMLNVLPLIKFESATG